MTTRTLQQFNVGTTIRMSLTRQDGTPFDLTGATVLDLWARKPSGRNVVWSALVDGAATDGVLAYVTGGGDLDEHGAWELQAHVITAGANLYGRRVPVNVLPNVSPPAIVLRPGPIAITSDLRGPGGG